LGDQAPAYNKCHIWYRTIYKEIICTGCYNRRMVPHKHSSPFCDICMVPHNHSLPFCDICMVSFVRNLGKNNMLYLGIIPRDILNIICQYFNNY
jgi:hypothetical protein